MAIQKISNAVIADNAIDSDNLASGAVTAADITDGTITTSKIADDSITSAKLAANSVTSAEIADSAVTNAKIDTIASTKITGRAQDNEDLPTIKPSLLLDFANQKTLDPRITFTRDSTATYYDGKTTVKAEENLLTNSQNFNSGWSISNAAILDNNAAAPDGTTTAAKITETDGGVRLQREPFSPLINYSGDIAYSMYFKEGSGTHYYSWLSLRGESGDVFWAVFNLNSGAVTTSGSSGTASISSATITSVGNGWYRCQIVGSYGQNYTNPIIYCGLSDGTAINSGGYYSGGSWTSDGSYIYAWGGQVEKRSSATAYTPTTSQPVTKYIPKLMTAPAGVARFDHDPVTKESKGLLIESQSSNVWYSDIMGGTDSDAVKPNGKTNGGRIIDRHAPYNWYKQHSQTSGTTWTLSVFAKAGLGSGKTLFGFEGLNQTADTRYTFNLLNGTIETAEKLHAVAAITDVGGGWYRLSVTATSTGTGYITAHMGNSGNDYENTVHAWGLQLEVGKFASSWIPDETAAATRNYDSAKISGTNFSDTVNPQNITVYAESDITHDYTWTNINSTVFNLGPDRVQYRIDDISGPEVLVFNPSLVAQLQNGDVSRNNHKAAIAYEYNNLRMSDTGKTVLSDTSCVWSDFTNLEIGAWGSAEHLNGYVKKIAVYNSLLTNAQLQALTQD